MRQLSKREYLIVCRKHLNRGTIRLGGHELLLLDRFIEMREM
jgi:hypothetical protein